MSITRISTAVAAKLLLLMLIGLHVSSAYAESGDDPAGHHLKPSQNTGKDSISESSVTAKTFSRAQRSCAVTPGAANVLTEVQAKLDAGEPNQALPMMRQLASASASGSCDWAYAARALGYLFVELKRYPEAIKFFRQALDAQKFGEADSTSLLLNLAQLNLQLGRASQVVDLLEPRLSADFPPLALFILGHAYTQLKQHRKALPYLRDAIDKAEMPEEVWYQSLLAVQYELRQYSDCIATLRSLVRLFPKKDYFVRLAALLSEQGRDLEAASVLETAYAAGLLEGEREIRWLAGVLLQVQAPQRAARILSRELETGGLKDSKQNLVFAGGAWQQAHETKRATELLEKAQRISGDAEIGLQLGRLWLGSGAWEKALEVLTRIESEVKEKQMEELFYLKGVSLFELDRPVEARKVLSQVLGFDGRLQLPAKQLIAYLDELENREAL